jgi:hypothetical protein
MPGRLLSSGSIPSALSRDEGDYRATILLHGVLSEQECIFYIGKNPQCVTQVTLREKSS